jgi:hypothetical protein
MCAACLRKTTEAKPVQKRGLAVLIRLGQCVAGLALAWLFFYVLGECLLALPTSFHEGTVWQFNWPETK